MNTEAPPLAQVPPRRESHGLWARMGGGSLMLATLFHILLLVAGGFWVFSIVSEPEKKVDFLPAGGGGGGGGGSAAAHQIQRKQQAKTIPAADARRVFAEGALSSYSIPDQGSTFGEMSPLGASGGGMSGGGFGGSGSGGGRGNGHGAGTGNGNGGGLGGSTLGIKLFGMDLNVKSIGVVLDVSGSMTPHLKRVLDEVHRVAKGSPVILHVGCGIGGSSERKRIQPVDAPANGFKRFWYLHHDPFYASQRSDNRTRVDFTRPLPSPEVFEILAKQPKTYYYEFAGSRTTGNALLSNEFRNVEAIYWFADFQDPIDPDEAEKIQKELIRRKQKLFIHASANGQNLPAAREGMAVPTGGGEVKVPKI